MKKILSTIAAGAIFIWTMSSNVAYAQKIETWYVGDNAMVQTICRSEDVILKVVKQDIEDSMLVPPLINQLRVTGDCIHFGLPLPFRVLDTIVSYKDSFKMDSVVLAVEDPRPGWKGEIAGYIIAAGVIGKPGKNPNKGINL